MAKFIEVTDINDSIHCINLDHIVSFKANDPGTTMISLSENPNRKVFTIKMPYQEFKARLSVL